MPRSAYFSGFALSCPSLMRNITACRLRHRRSRWSMWTEGGRHTVTVTAKGELPDELHLRLSDEAFAAQRTVSVSARCVSPRLLARCHTRQNMLRRTASLPVLST